VRCSVHSPFESEFVGFDTIDLSQHLDLYLCPQSSQHLWLIGFLFFSSFQTLSKDDVREWYRRIVDVSP
jgi:hypothetical protein